VIGEGKLRLWGLDGRTRIDRQLRSLGDIAIITDLSSAGPEDPVLLIRADHVFELRALSSLIPQQGVLIANGRPAAAMASGRDAAAALRVLTGGSGSLPLLSIDDLDAYAVELRKAEPPLVTEVTEANREALESRLYGGSYKGVTDFVTKWWWPRPARKGVQIAAHLGLTPNMVTGTGVLLMLIALWAFAEGHYVFGLVCGWVMTWLDTVDGKLARVTVQSSRIGHILDHGMDIVHPPFWYWAFGASLGAAYSGPFGLTLDELVIAVFAAYIGGRLTEAAFHLLGPIGLFAWRPFDAYFRLYTARRNPCLVLMTVALPIGGPEWSFLLVVAWSVLSTLILMLRLLYAIVIRLQGKPLTSWLADPASRDRFPRAYATFSATRAAYE
jgi:phosphatidylglycerophosphate synthase